MARKVFFSFHFKRDAWRAAQVRNSDLLADEDEYGVMDAVEWEKLERTGPEAIMRWINDQLQYTSVTVILIGAETAGREWVNYEIRKSWERGNALVGLRIHGVKNPLDEIHLEDGTPLSAFCKTYDWNTDNGRENLGRWVEDAFQERIKYHGETRLKDEPACEIPVSGTSPSFATVGISTNSNSGAFKPKAPWSCNA